MAKRDGLLRLLADCDRGLIDYIIVKSISRFSRNTVESIETVRSLCDKGIYIFFEKVNIDTGKMEGELLLSILSSLAESESHSIAENNKWSIQKRYQNGTFKIGYTPYGYDNVDGKMVINEEQAETVRWIFASVLSGKSPGRIAKELNEKGVRTKRDGRWTGHTINGMIKNEKYTGDVIHQKTYTDDRFNRHVNRGERTQYMVRGHHDAIISHEDFDAANALLERNGLEKGIRKDADKYKNRYAMSGKLICGECGGKLKRVKLNSHFGFACNTHVTDKDACGMKAIPEEPVKAAFATMMNKLTWGRNRILLPFAEMLKEDLNAETLGRLSELESLLEKNAERKAQITQFFTRGLLDPAVYAEESDVLTEEAERLAAEQNMLTSQISGLHEQQEALSRLLKYTAKGKTLTEFDDVLFTEHVDHIVVYERTEIRFAMKCGPVFRERI
jgi:DNA invertase Pin-like site-specific DNA recombinase